MKSERPKWVSTGMLDEAADAFVASMGTNNAQFLRDNLGLVVVASDALRALKDALYRDRERN